MPDTQPTEAIEAALRGVSEALYDGAPISPDSLVGKSVVIALAAALPHLAQHVSPSIHEAVADLVWKATPYGETADGDTMAYLVPKGALHRLVGAMECAGAPTPLRAAEAVDR